MQQKNVYLDDSHNQGQIEGGLSEFTDMSVQFLLGAKQMLGAL